jgi:hypothetical protein
VPAVAGLNLEHIVTGEHLEDVKTFFEPRHAPMTLTRLSDTCISRRHRPLAWKAGRASPLASRITSI